MGWFIEKEGFTRKVWDMMSQTAANSARLDKLKHVQHEL
jgi:hypothetical protein